MSNKKSDKLSNKTLCEKLSRWITIFASISTISGISVLTIITSVKDRNDLSTVPETEPSNQQSLISDDDENKSYKISIDNNMIYNKSEDSSNQTDEIIISVETAIKDIQDKYYSLPKLSSLPEPTEDDPIYKYIDENQMIIFKVKRGYDDIKYSRIYYLDENGKLYFALIFDKTKENSVLTC